MLEVTDILKPYGGERIAAESRVFFGGEISELKCYLVVVVFFVNSCRCVWYFFRYCSNRYGDCIMMRFIIITRIPINNHEKDNFVNHIL